MPFRGGGGGVPGGLPWKLFSKNEAKSCILSEIKGGSGHPGTHTGHAPEKCHFVLINGRMIAIGPYVVVFWTLSRLVLVRKGCDVAFGPYSQSNMVEQAVTCSCVHQSPGHHASRRQISHQGSTQRCKGSTRVTETRPNILARSHCDQNQRRCGQVAWQRHELDQNVAATFQIVTATSGGGATTWRQHDRRCEAYLCTIWPEVCSISQIPVC